MRQPMRVDLRYLVSDRDRHGNVRHYVRRHGRKIRIRETPGSPQFLAAYSAAVERLETPDDTRGAGPRHVAQRGTLGWLAAAYFGHAAFAGLATQSQRTRRAIIETCLLEPLKPGGKDLMRDCPLHAFGAAHLRVLRDRKHEMPGAANNRLKYLGSMLGWAVENGHLRANPARDVKPLSYASDGFYTWTVEDVRKFEERHPIGTKARLAMALLLFLGVRRGDVVTIGKQHIQDGWLRIVPRKTRHKRVTPSFKPILPALAEIIAASPSGGMTLLVTEFGKPFTAAGFGNWFRDRCDEAGVPGSAHGLRKAGATIAAENGATDRQLMALYDWSSANQASVYTAAADRRRMAADAARLLGGTPQEQPSVPPDCPTEKLVAENK